MLATPGKLFSAKGWIFELKHDGFRCLVTKCGDLVRLEPRSGRDLSPCFPELVEEIRPIRADFASIPSSLFWTSGARKAALYHTLPANRRIRYAGHFADSCKELWHLAVELELEGIVAKRADSRYMAGRSNFWQKIKTTAGEERESQRRPGR